MISSNNLYIICPSSRSCRKEDIIDAHVYTIAGNCTNPDLRVISLTQAIKEIEKNAWEVGAMCGLK